MPLIPPKQIAAGGAANGQALVYASSTGLWGPGSAGSAGSAAAFDIDLTAEANQTLSSNTTYTIGSRTWTVENAANSSPSMALVNGTGLTIDPVNSPSTYIDSGDRLAPLVKINLNSYISSFDPSSRLRAWVYFTSTGFTSDFHNFIVGVEADTTNEWVWYAQRVYNASKGGSGWTINNIRSQTTNTLAGNNILTDTTADVMCLELPHGVESNYAVVRVGTYSAGFPAIASMKLIINKFGLAADFDPATHTLSAATNYSLLIASGRVASATAHTDTVKRIKLEVG